MAPANRNSRPLTFENLRFLRAEAALRDSTLDQRDGFGPDIQRRNIQRFADSYGLVLGDKWYTEFVSGWQAKKRAVLEQFIEDAYGNSVQAEMLNNARACRSTWNREKLSR